MPSSLLDMSGQKRQLVAMPEAGPYY